MTRIAAILMVLIAVFFLPATAAAEASGTCTVSGTVRLDDAEAADGTLVTAIIAGDEYHTHTSTGYGYSTYSLTIRAPDGKNYPDGTRVSFKVNGHSIGQIAVFKAGANIKLDLTASTASALSSTTIAIIARLVHALLAAGAAAYYLFLRRGLRITDWLSGKSGAPSEQAVPLSVEGQDQPVERYIWDNAKLAWVKNTEQAKSNPRGLLTQEKNRARKPR